MVTFLLCSRLTAQRLATRLRFFQLLQPGNNRGDGNVGIDAKFSVSSLKRAETDHGLTPDF